MRQWRALSQRVDIAKAVVVADQFAARVTVADIDKNSMSMRYELRFRDIHVGIVTLKDSDFPNLWGDIDYDDVISHPTSENEIRMSQFIELNRESTRLVDLEDQEDVAAKLDLVNQQLVHFNDYIESDDWLLVNEGGETLPILVPMFRNDREIVWRWNHVS